MAVPNIFYEVTKPPRRYFTLGVATCSIGGLIFSIGIILVVLGSSDHEPEALWICGIVLLLIGAILFFFGMASIGVYLRREDERRREEERQAARNYASSLRSTSQISLAD